MIYYGQGTQMLMKQNYTKALTHLLKAAEIEPENSDILNNLGMAYYFKGDKESAKQYITLSLRYDPKNHDASQNLATMALEEGNLTEAKEIYQKILKDLTYDKQARTYYNLGVVSLKQKNSQEAFGLFKKSIAEDVTYCPSYLQIGKIFLAENNFQQALENFKEAGLGNCNKDPAPLYYQALAYKGLGDYAMANTKLTKLIKNFKGTKFYQVAKYQLLEVERAMVNDKKYYKAQQETSNTPKY